MIIARTPFFVSLMIFVSAPFLLTNLWWLGHSVTTTGTMCFVGKSITGQMEHSYSVISFVQGKDTIFLNGPDNVLFPKGERVRVRYQKDNPGDARLDRFVAIWGETLAYGGVPMIILLIAFLNRGVVPANAKIRFGTKSPFISIIQKEV